jgi:hypothetical protein
VGCVRGRSVTADYCVFLNVFSFFLVSLLFFDLFFIILLHLELISPFSSFDLSHPRFLFFLCLSDLLALSNPSSSSSSFKRVLSGSCYR